MSDTGNRLVHFFAGKLSSFSGLSTLNNLDLQFVCVCKIPDGNAKAAGSYLFNCRTLGITVGHRRKTSHVLTAFPSV